jgi:hypothetical protein
MRASGAKSGDAFSLTLVDGEVDATVTAARKA